MSVVALKQPGSSPLSYSPSPSSICSSDPTENWDEDFEFNASAHAQDIEMHNDNDLKDAPAPARAAPAPPTTPFREKKNSEWNVLSNNRVVRDLQGTLFKVRDVNVLTFFEDSESDRNYTPSPVYTSS